MSEMVQTGGEGRWIRMEWGIMARVQRARLTPKKAGVPETGPSPPWGERLARAS